VLGVVGAGGVGQEMKNSMDRLVFPTAADSASPSLVPTSPAPASIWSPP
jgi:ABC-type phosphate/phosphonate transport system permease subunit